MKKIFGFILLFFISLVSGQEYLRYEYVNKGEDVEFYNLIVDFKTKSDDLDIPELGSPVFLYDIDKEKKNNNTIYVLKGYGWDKYMLVKEFAIIVKDIKDIDGILGILKESYEENGVYHHSETDLISLENAYEMFSRINKHRKIELKQKMYEEATKVAISNFK